MTGQLPKSQKADKKELRRQIDELHKAVRDLDTENEYLKNELVMRKKEAEHAGDRLVTLSLETSGKIMQLEKELLDAYRKIINAMLAT